MLQEAIVRRSTDLERPEAPVETLPPRQEERAWSRRLVDRLALRTLGPEYSERVEALKRDSNDFGVDEFGVDPDYIRGLGIGLAWLYRYYFRVQVQGIEHVPQGRVLLISNHSGVVPFDGAMIATAMFFEGEPPRIPRTMVERFTATLPYLSILSARVGNVIGMPENARRLLEHDHSLLVFPEGAKGSNKMFSEAYHLRDFGYGFMRLALETQTPIVPIAVIGAEEQYPAVFNLKRVAKLVGIPALPVTPFALLPLIGMLPLPTKYRIQFGEPMYFTGDPDDDDAVIGEKVWLVRSTIQNMVNHGIRARDHVFW
jgi:1-acyl-sn-glycerol-3-phosphate acyltransferase